MHMQVNHLGVVLRGLVCLIQDSMVDKINDLDDKASPWIELWDIMGLFDPL
jgi:hypothetical protein